MNAYLNDYVNISDKDYYSYLAFYESSAFVRETMLLKIPDVVQYVHNILSCLRDAEQSRLIVEDIESQIVNARTRYKGLTMEGFEVTPKMREQCQRVLDGEFTTTDALMQLLSEREQQSLRNALASTRMEGFEVTEQMLKDCVQLMRGEVSIEEIIDEILKRPL